VSPVQYASGKGSLRAYIAVCLRYTATRLVTKGAEFYHRHMNVDFIAPHPNIYIFVEALLRQYTSCNIRYCQLTVKVTDNFKIHT